jgi:hypothetical protein
VAAALDGLTQQVTAGQITPAAACRQLLELYRPAG